MYIFCTESFFTETAHGESNVTCCDYRAAACLIYKDGITPHIQSSMLPTGA